MTRGLLRHHEALGNLARESLMRCARLNESIRRSPICGECTHENFDHATAQFGCGNHEWLFSSFPQLSWNVTAQETLKIVTRGEDTMKATLIALAAVSLLTVAMPASAQDYGWRDRDRDWRDHNWRRHDRSGIRLDLGRSYARGDCSMKVTRIHRPNGTVVTRRVRSCDY